ncbi:MAG: hypothetical protein FWC61_02455, partial [Proteobacteria bacterium]|nr:hypothetical protein [Pseudomonadota bacterium]
MKKLFLSLIILISAFCGGAFAADNVPVSDSAGDIGPFGTWATPANQSAILGNLRGDLTSFQTKFQAVTLVPDWVPPEARVGRSLIGAMSRVNEILHRSLFDFISVFIIILLAFWIALESYQFAKDGGDAKAFAYKIAMRIVLCGIWIWIISNDPARLFMMIAGPIIYVGSYFSDTILNSVTTAAHANMPDTCAAIHSYIAANPVAGDMMPPDAVAGILCVPTRLAGFFYTCVAAGFKWMIAGIGHSAMTFVVGLSFVVLFIMNIWKFAIMALGVIVNLFLIILFLPFTAIAETFGDKKTEYKGIAGEIFSKFADIFSVASLSDQFQKFITAVIYFISLSVIIAICAALLSGVVTTNLADAVPDINSADFMTVFLCGILVFYL